MPMKRALLIGAVETTSIAFDALIRHPHWTIGGVVTLQPELSHRHSDFTDITVAARAKDCPVIHVDNINRDEALDAMAKVRPDYVFVMGWSQICGPRFMERFSDRVIGYHPAALPRLRGRAAIPWTILRQEPITAGSLFWIDAGTDTGAILDQQFFHVAPLETASSLYAKHMAALTTMLDRSLGALARDQAGRIVQDEACATWAARRTPIDGLIDWSLSASEVARLIRASGRPYPGAFTRLNAADLHIWAASVEDAEPHLARPGQVIARAENSFTVMCGNRTALAVTDWSGAEKPPRLHVQLGE
ncbi:formyltransferase family protein [Sphingobium sp. ZW T5_29]|uniref:formyltransferase family protein n=1 Tax=Sphingobium sp. ZW T5_29 TaxID=3378077 RepID=UPI0038528D18